MSESIYLSDRLYLAIDQGGHATRAMVFDHQGQMVCESQSPLSASHPAPGFVEYDAEAMLQAEEPRPVAPPLTSRAAAP